MFVVLPFTQEAERQAFTVCKSRKDHPGLPMATSNCPSKTKPLAEVVCFKNPLGGKPNKTA